MKRFSLTLAAAVALAVSACAGTPAAPNADQVARIETACAVDAGVRPTVTALLAVPGLATPQEVAGVVAARAIIDPICANPAGSIQANAIAAVSSASAQIVGIVAQLQARKAAPSAK